MTQQTLNIVPEYRYIIASVKDGTIKMEVPFSGVSWERKINGSGSFSGDIGANPVIDTFDIYNSTLPGKYAIYIFRDGVLVWGGIIWSRDYDIMTKSLTVSALEFTSYLFHRIFWKTIYFNDGITVKELLEGLLSATINDELNISNPYSASDTHILPTYFSQSGTIVTFTTEEIHGFEDNDLVLISGTQYSDWNGVRQVSTVVGNSRAFTFVSNNNGGGVAQPRTLSTTAFSVDGPQYAILKSTYDTIQSSVDVNLDYHIDAALANYQIIGTGDDNPFEFRGHKFNYVGEILNNFAQNGVPSMDSTVSSTGAYPKVIRTSPSLITTRISRKSLTSNVALLTTSEAHGLSVGDSVTISNVDATFDGAYTIISPVTSNTFSYAKTSANVEDTYVKTQYTSVRFDYHVVPSYNSGTRTFSNTFRAWEVKKDTNKPLGTVEDGNALTNLTGPSKVYGGTSLGANQFIFEHPGNIVSLTLTEDAESSASRTWVVDSVSDIGPSGAPPYGSYTNLPYLNAGFPMLDRAVTDVNLPVAVDEEILPFAKEIGYKLAPPIGEYRITVNGSLQPEVNTYQPGDWCIIIPNDAFINNRLTVPYENRIGILVRKIKSYKVNVPDNPSFPETVELEVVPEWEVS